MISPIADAKKRKYRDLPCVGLFIAFWVAIIVIAIYGSVQSGVRGSRDVDSRIWLYMQPGDELRRMCGYSADDQPDYLATDYSGYAVQESELKNFCRILKNEVFSDGTKLNLSDINCDGLNSASSVRPFVKRLSSYYNNMQNHTHGIRANGETVCSTVTNCIEIPSDKDYVCHREFVDIYNSVMKTTETTGFYSDKDVINAIDKLQSTYTTVSFLRKFCVKLPTYNKNDGGQYRTDYIPAPVVYGPPINGNICEQNLTEKVTAVLSDLQSSPGASYLLDFFSETSSNMIIELKTQKAFIIISCIMSLGFAYVVAYLLKLIVAILTWVILLGVVLGSAGLATALLIMANKVKEENAYRQLVYGYIDVRANSTATLL